ncbi:MAG TPA: hypothetical protein VIY54_05405 [Steroidobacteraceae bacterium]
MIAKQPTNEKRTGVREVRRVIARTFSQIGEAELSAWLRAAAVANPVRAIELVIQLAKFLPQLPQWATYASVRTAAGRSGTGRTCGTGRAERRSRARFLAGDLGTAGAPIMRQITGTR